jgi:hypothetical protein
MATFCDMAYTWDANKNKTSESITGGMSGYGFTAAGTTYDFEDRLTGFSRAATSGPAVSVHAPDRFSLSSGPACG